MHYFIIQLLLLESSLIFRTAIFMWIIVTYWTFGCRHCELSHTIWDFFVNYCNIPDIWVLILWTLPHYMGFPFGCWYCELCDVWDFFVNHCNIPDIWVLILWTLPHYMGFPFGCWYCELCDVWDFFVNHCNIPDIWVPTLWTLPHYMGFLCELL
jgi:hypothetical protein